MAIIESPGMDSGCLMRRSNSYNGGCDGTLPGAAWGLGHPSCHSRGCCPEKGEGVVALRSK